MTIYHESNKGREYLPYTYLIAWSPDQTGLDHWIYYGEYNVHTN